MSAYYNEIDPKAAAWLRELIKAGVIAPGIVDERSISDLSPHDLHGYTQCHFFAGVGVWSYALRRAGWPDDRPVWTGSCPCQPFSAAGKQLGTKDERHLWPRFYDLIAFGAPPVVFGEQVASEDGRDWLAGVRADLEGLGYAVGAADLCAAGAGPEAEGWIVRGDQAGWERIINGSPNIRQRLFWMANAQGKGRPGMEPQRPSRLGERARAGRDRTAGRLAHADGGQSRHGGLQSGGQHGQQPEDGGVAGGLGNPGSSRGGWHAGAVSRAEGEGQGERIEPRRLADELVDAGAVGGVADSANERGPEHEHGSGRRAAPGTDNAPECGGARGLEHAASNGREQRRPEPGRRGSAGGCCDGFWDAFDIVHCTDGKARRIEPGSFPLAHGVAGRVGLLRGYGNAINAELATEFIETAIECGVGR